MSNKPTIRHCKNCEYSSDFNFTTDSLDCKVKYKHLLDCEQRISALLCRFYKQRSDDNENPN